MSTSSDIDSDETINVEDRSDDGSCPIMNYVTNINEEESTNTIRLRLPLRRDQSMTNLLSIRRELTIDKEDAPRRKRPRLELDEAAQETAEFGGYPDLVSEVRRLMSHLRHVSKYLSLGMNPPRGFLLHGPPGSGKTLLARAVAAQLQLPLHEVTEYDLMSYSAVSAIRNTFEVAALATPSVVLIDGMQAVTERRDVQKFLATAMDKLEPGIMVVGTIDSLDGIISCLRTTGRFDKELAIGVPGLEDRTSILNVLTANIRLEPGLSMNEVAALTPGFLGGDLKSLISEAGMETVDKTLNAEDVSEEQLKTLFIRKEAFTISLKRIQPLMKRRWYVKVPEVTWDDVGSLESVRQQLRMSIILPVTHPDEFTRMGIDRPAGILLCGPPGCGKTLIAKAVANESQLNFLSVKGPELLSMYVGESERGVRQCFHRAKACRPCVIFIDEIDSLCPRRYGSSEGSNITARVVNQFLAEMDGVEDRSGVFLLAATNRPDILDTALLRPGRFDKIVWVGLPSAKARVDILRALTRNVPLSDVNMEELANNSRLDGFSGADLSALVKEACVVALTRHLDNKSAELQVTMDIFQEVASKLSPSVKDLSFYRRIEQSVAGKSESARSHHVGIS